LLCLVLAVVKPLLVLPWLWWRVLLPLWVMLWHNAGYLGGRVHLVDMEGMRPRRR